MEFKITINAPKEKVWNTLWEDESYRAWTAVFAEGSRAETDWKKGSKVLFLDGNGSGMVALVADAIPNQFMSIKHMGSVENGVEDTESEEVKKWAGSFENYTLHDLDGQTELHVEMGGANLPDEMENQFKEMWPKALQKLKALAEEK